MGRSKGVKEEGGKCVRKEGGNCVRKEGRTIIKRKRTRDDWREGGRGRK